MTEEEKVRVLIYSFLPQKSCWTLSSRKKHEKIHKSIQRQLRNWISALSCDQRHCLVLVSLFFYGVSWCCSRCVRPKPWQIFRILECVTRVRNPAMSNFSRHVNSPRTHATLRKIFLRGSKNFQGGSTHPVFRQRCKQEAQFRQHVRVFFWKPNDC